MRFYGENFAKNAMDKSARSFIESRDALIWEVLTEERTCKVRIQGSNQDVIVKFPQNLSTVPTWLRKGNSVRIAHRSGVRGYLYIIGQGTTIPSPLAGEPMPDPDPLLDAILTGCEVTAIDPPSMSVYISSGTFRINEVVYNLSVNDNPLLFGQTPELFFGQVPELFFGGTIIKYLDAAPAAGLFRYDAFVVGENRIIDYLKGSASTSPVKPTIPNDHLLIDDYILIIGGMTEVEDKHIGMQFTTPVISSIDIDIESSGISYTLPYDDGGGSPPQYTEADIVFTVLDQYLNTISGSYTLKLDNVSGDGDLWSDDTGYHATNVSQAITDYEYTFKYRREQALDDGVVVFSANVTVSGTEYELIGVITLEIGV